MLRKMNVALDDIAIMPERAHDLDAGIDLFTPINFIVPAHSYSFVDTGVHIELPYGSAGHVRSKSGLSRDHGLFVDGTIDEGYTGSIGVTIFNNSNQDYYFSKGDKIAQLVVEAIFRPGLNLVDEVSGGERGNNGFGSTGK